MLESDDEPDDDSSDLEFDSDFKGEAIFVLFLNSFKAAVVSRFC